MPEAHVGFTQRSPGLSHFSRCVALDRMKPNLWPVAQLVARTLRVFYRLLEAEHRERDLSPTENNKAKSDDDDGTHLR